MATPQVPPRPARSHNPASASTLDAGRPSPEIPPRPVRRKDRSVSPDRYAPSPLNDDPRRTPGAGPYGSSKNNLSSTSVDAPPRPPSVNLPSIGQEGNEYGDLERHDQQTALEKTISANETTTSHIDSDLPLHAPKPSLPKAGARAQIATVTRTDSSQAAATVTESAISPRGENDPFNRPLKSKTSSNFMRSTSSLSNDRPGSASQLDEHGIPHIGRHVPMLPNAGDVQAPSPAPGQHHGLGTDADGSRHRHHGRKHSGREIFHGPPGSYGMHGHGSPHNDKFEKNWYAKHPEELAKEDHGHYSPALSGRRPEWALSSDDLNKIVHDTAKGHGYGTSGRVVGLPNEQIGYMATEEYANRLHAPRSQGTKHRRSSNSQSHVDSPLRQTAFPQDALVPGTKPKKGLTTEGDEARDAQDVIHIDMPQDEVNRITGEGLAASQEGLGHHRRTSSDADGGYAEERGYSAPILASDEVTPGSEWQQPAVSPAFPAERRGSGQFDEFGHVTRHFSHLSSANSSRPGSRPGSIHGIPALTRVISHDEHDDRHTPLEDVDEYEPLFPDEVPGRLNQSNHADRLKRRPDMRQRFPSQDIWEDTPNSLRLETEVNSPEPEEDRQTASLPHPVDPSGTAEVFETPSEEAMRKENAIPLSENGKTPNDELLKKRGIRHEDKERLKMRMGQRFPSHDIWEDSPDFASLTTTVQSPQQEEEVSLAETQDGETPTSRAEQSSIVPKQDPELSGSTSKESLPSHPLIPPRPAKKQSSVDSAGSAADARPSQEADVRKAPIISDRPKPQIPARPVKSSSHDSAENVPLTKTVSAGSLDSVEEDSSKSHRPPPPAAKSKPTVPIRPVGGKIAALQAGFMADLNSRLKIGPQVQQPVPPKQEELEEEKTPLQDARKGRARGPARRKPGVIAADSEASTKASDFSLSLIVPWTVWHSETSGSIIVPTVSSIQTKTKATDDLQPSEPATKDDDEVPQQTSLGGAESASVSHSSAVATNVNPEEPEESAVPDTL